MTPYSQQPERATYNIGVFPSRNPPDTIEFTLFSDIFSFKLCLIDIFVYQSDMGILCTWVYLFNYFPKVNV